MKVIGWSVRAAVGIAITTFAGVAGSGLPAGASCTGPVLDVDRTSVAVGAAVEIHGRFFGSPCNDAGQDDPPGPPLRQIIISIIQAGAPAQLAVVDANGDYEFRVRAGVPESIRPGPATITATGSNQAAIIVTPGVAPTGATPTPTILTRAVPYSPRRGEQIWVLWSVSTFIALFVTVIILARRVRDDQRWARSGCG
jgi:hypothetical protein